MLQSQASKLGDCEVCDRTNLLIHCHYGNMWFCDECWEKESAFAQSQVPTEKKVAAYQSSVESKVIETSRALDSTIQVRTDLFNAATVAIVDLKKSIDENPEITNKPYALAEELKSRFDHFRQVIFDNRQIIIESENNLKAIQVYLNQMANSLRQEEREKLKIADINYQPKITKPTVKKISTRKKLDKVELRKYAKELDIHESTLQMIVVSKGITVPEAADMLRKLKASASGNLVK